MKLAPPPQSPWWQANPEHGFDWKAYRALEERLIKAGDFKQLQDIHDVIDEEELSRAYDHRSMDKGEGEARKRIAARNPPRLVPPGSASPWSAPAKQDARIILKDPNFAPKPSPWGNAKAGIGAGVLGLLMGMFDKQSASATMGRDEDYMMGPHLPWGGEGGLR